MEQSETALRSVAVQSVRAPRWTSRYRIAGTAAVSRFELIAVAMIMASALGIRLLWIHLMPVPPESDFGTFLQMAQAIADGHWPADSYGWTFQGPGYPLLLSPLLYSGFGLSALRLANVLFQLGMVACVWLLGRRSFGPGAGIAGAALAALLPGIWVYTPLVAAENLAVLLMCLVVLMLGAKRQWAASVSGAGAAALAYSRPAYLALLPILAAVALLSPRVSLRRFAWYVAGVALVLLPLAALNVSNHGPALPGSAAGFQLWLTNNERATGAWFPAADSDDYPFKGLDSTPEGAALLPAAQRKLGLQFVFANPDASLRWAAKRHRLQWSRDSMGAFWTVDRAPTQWRDRVPLVDHRTEIFDKAYLALLALAAPGAIRLVRRPTILIPILVPLAYVLALFAASEANGRYHAVVLPLLCVLAGATLVPFRRAVWSLLFAVLAASLAPERSIGALLIPFIVVAPAALLLVRAFSILRAVPARYTRSWAPVAIALGLVLAVAASFAMNRMIDRTLAELDAVRPTGWTTYDAAPHRQAESIPLTLVDSGTMVGLRKVSYPDGVALRFTHQPVPGEMVFIARTLPELQQGATYHFYLQVYDPGPDADASESLTVALNDRIVWQRGPGEARAAGWQYLSIPWVADAPTVTIRVERTAGTNPGAATRATPVVRTLHLYPKY